MRLLAIDTSSPACSVALSSESAVFERHEEQPREHTRLVLPMIRAVLSESDVALSDLDAIVLGNGPGSFIGMRIAASVAQGLAYGAGLRIVPVSSLAAVAAQAFAETAATEALVAQDAHMSEVYLGGFRRGEDNLPAPAFPERLHGQAVIDEIENRDAGGRAAAGFGWRRYPRLAELNAPYIEEHLDFFHPRARFLLPLGAISLQLGKFVDPKDVTPAYLRNKVAERPPMAGS